MSVTFEGSYELPTVQVTLPNPEFGDHESPVNELTIAKSINGTVRTFVKSKDGRVRINNTFRLTRAKALELYYFYKTYAKGQIKYTDRTGKNWRGYFSIDPIDLESVSSFLGNSKLGDALVQITIEMELYEI